MPSCEIAFRTGSLVAPSISDSTFSKGLCASILVFLIVRRTAKAEMSIRVRRSEILDSDRGLLITLYRRHLAADYAEERFDWLYQRGPHGQAFAWIASDSANGEPIGAAAAFPRKVYCHGQ